MLMFQNGLLLTFIPEILMVIGFLVCLFTPGSQSRDSRVEQTQLVAQISNYVPQQHSAYQLTTKDFQIAPQIDTYIWQSFPPLVKKDTYLSYESTFTTSDGLSYVDFSRPPPTFVS